MPVNSGLPVGSKLECQDNVRESAEECIETHPKQQQQRPRWEVLLRCPESQANLEDARHKTEPPDAVDCLSSDRFDDVQGPLEHEEEAKDRSKGPERVDRRGERPYRPYEEQRSHQDSCPPPTGADRGYEELLDTGCQEDNAEQQADGCDRGEIHTQDD